MMTAIVTLLIFGFVAIAALGHVLLLSALLLGTSDTTAPVTGHDGSRAQPAPSHAYS